MSADRASPDVGHGDLPYPAASSTLQRPPGVNGRSVKKIPKACEPCRAHKKRCSGGQPCSACNEMYGLMSGMCVYRERTRTRKALGVKVRTTAVTSSPTEKASPPGKTRADDAVSSRPSKRAPVPPMAGNGSGSGSGSDEEYDHARTEVYRSVSAHDCSRHSIDTPQLFYGPSSNFAFLQQLHRAIVLAVSKDRDSRKADDNTSSGSAAPDDAPSTKYAAEGGAGLDMFQQRSIFFGMPSEANGRINLLAIPHAHAVGFLDHFESILMPMMPFVHVCAGVYRAMVDDIFGPSGRTLLERLVRYSEQRVLVLFVVLAIGAQYTEDSQTGEQLVEYALVCAGQMDTVSLPMVQFDLLMAEYQMSMARCNAAWIRVGNAAHKAVAMGLHSADVAIDNLRLAANERETTVWSLYCMDVWLAVMTGRKVTLSAAAITIPRPVGQPALSILCHVSSILEKTSDQIYQRKADSLRGLHATASSLHEELYECSRMYNLGFPPLVRYHGEKVENPHAILMITNIWRHAFLLTWRPFLVADTIAAPTRSPTKSEPWLVQACREAVHNARNAIWHICLMYKDHPACQRRRFTVFFVEASCAVLLYDVLRSPGDCDTNMAFVSDALRLFESMFHVAPVTTACASVRRMHDAVRSVIERMVVLAALAEPSAPDGRNVRTDEHHAGCDTSSTGGAAPTATGLFAQSPTVPLPPHPSHWVSGASPNTQSPLFGNGVSTPSLTPVVNGLAGLGAWGDIKPDGSHPQPPLLSPTQFTTHDGSHVQNQEHNFYLTQPQNHHQHQHHQQHLQPQPPHPQYRQDGLMPGAHPMGLQQDPDAEVWRLYGDHWDVATTNLLQFFPPDLGEFAPPPPPLPQPT